MIFDRQRQSLRVGERTYTPDTIDEWTSREDLPETEGRLVRWLADWWSASETIQVQTSGSTGTPKRLLVDKVRMMRSAQMTVETLALGAEDTALLCMDLRYIGAMMLVVRALISEMRLVVRMPSANPLIDLEADISFAAFVPLQVYEILRHSDSRALLASIRCVIIGGGAISLDLEQALRPMSNAIYSTYGMTETLSHIALRRLSGTATSRYYTPLANVRLDISPEQTLRIYAPDLCTEWLETNDIVQMVSGRQFVVLGRRDHIINSGGIKIQLEQLETTISGLIPLPLALTWRADERLGQSLILVLESGNRVHLSDINSLLVGKLPPYHQPKGVIALERLPRLSSGKLDRLALQRLAEETPPCR